MQTLPYIWTHVLFSELQHALDVIDLSETKIRINKDPTSKIAIKVKCMILFQSSR